MKPLKPNYIFETSWEICNKVGGIHTVVSTKALTLVQEYGDQLLLIGPDVWRDSDGNPEFTQDDTLMTDWREQTMNEGLQIRIGRWNIVGTPVVILIDFSAFISQKDNIFTDFWEEYKLDSISGQWDYIEPATFGYAAGKVVESFYQFFVADNQKVIAHFHEWMTGTGVLYLKKYAPHIATLFTTHATAIGRSIAGNRLPLYRNLKTYNGDSKAKEFNIISKQSLEKSSATHADCFTTVSHITANECEQLLERKPDVVTPNGFEDHFVPQGKAFDEKYTKARNKLRQVSESLLGYHLPKKTRYICTSGRYEFWNKGIDAFIEAVAYAKEQNQLERTVVAFILVPANNYGARKDLAHRIENNIVDAQTGNRFLTHGLHDADFDPSLKMITKLGLENKKEDKVKIIFVPSYLQANDGIFNMTYYDLLIGFDLTVFPSYYEPWGYTPLESLAFHIPTITTDLAGFGRWIKQEPVETSDCLQVINRTDDNFVEVYKRIAEIVTLCASKSKEDKLKAKENAYFVSRIALWKNLIKYYFEAYEIALLKLEKRSNKLTERKPTKKTVNLPTYKSITPVWREIQVNPHLEGQFKGLTELSKNLWWTWNCEAKELFEYISPRLWKRNKQNPVAMLNQVSLDKFQRLEKDSVFVDKYNNVFQEFINYMNEPKAKDVPAIAYFSMEYGMSSTFKIYSGGLGILAGDYMKQASDGNVNMIGVGLLYKLGYFTQRISPNGEQEAVYEPISTAHSPVIPMKDENGIQKTIQIVLPGRVVHARIWKVAVGRIDLYLLDTDLDENKEKDRALTHQLYGGNNEYRLQQEILLGIGGIRLLEKMKIQQEVYHCNEGHAAFISLERMHKLINEKNFSYGEAVEIVKASTLFTTHTPVPAGHDTFSEDLIMTYMGHYPTRLKISWQEFIALGRVNASDNNEKFSMSNLAAHLSQEINGVSMLHGKVTREMFKNLWQGYFAEELHIGHVTNGVHFPTWTAKAWQQLYKETMSEDFNYRHADKKMWSKIHDVPNERIWEIRQTLRKELFDMIRDRLEKRGIRTEKPKNVVKILHKLDDKTLTIGFARRFATYKRGNLLFSDLDELNRIVNNPEMPVQFVFAGKAHPNDGGGQEIIKEVIRISQMPQFVGKIIFLENYDMDLAKKLVSGVDIWLNTPTRPLEASGTSGMKAVMNGVMNFSVLDGWWVEGYKEGAGWALDEEKTYEDQRFQNEYDAATIYNLLREEIVPLFYDRDEKGIPNAWIKHVKKTIAEIAPDFTSSRMLDDYIVRYYRRLAESTKKIAANDYLKAREIATWKKKIRHNWDKLEVVALNFSDPIKDPLILGERYYGELVLDLNKLGDTNVSVEMVINEIDTEGQMHVVEVIELQLMRLAEEHIASYAIDLTAPRPGNFNYGFRVFPKSSDLPYRQSFGLVKWI